MSAETLEREAILELAAVLKLPPASGTVSRLVRLLIDAAVARIEEAKQLQSPAANFDNAKRFLADNPMAKPPTLSLRK